jgi:hypothetical protein
MQDRAMLRSNLSGLQDFAEEWAFWVCSFFLFLWKTKAINLRGLGTESPTVG